MPALTQGDPDSTVFVMWLGRDTTHVTWIIRNGDHVRLETLIRSPEVRLVATEAALNPDHGSSSRAAFL